MYSLQTFSPVTHVVSSPWVLFGARGRATASGLLSRPPWRCQLSHTAVDCAHRRFDQMPSLSISNKQNQIKHPFLHWCTETFSQCYPVVSLGLALLYCTLYKTGASFLFLHTDIESLASCFWCMFYARVLRSSWCRCMALFEGFLFCLTGLYLHQSCVILVTMVW